MPNRAKCFYGDGTLPDSSTACMHPEYPLMSRICTRQIRARCPFFKSASVPNAIPADRKGDDRHDDNGILLAMHQ